MMSEPGYIQCEQCEPCEDSLPQAVFIGGHKGSRWQWECTECGYVFWSTESPDEKDHE